MRDIRVERLLESEGIKYEFVSNYDIDKVKFDAKAQAQIRIKGTDPDKVSRYASFMKRQGGPRTFPAIVVAKDGAGLSGKHRHDATRKGGYGGTDVYICDTLEPDVIRRLRIQLNVIEGDGEPRDDLLLHAFHLATAGGYTQREAADLVGVPGATVSRFIRRERFKVAMMNEGVPEATLSRLPSHSIDAIHLVPRTALQKDLCVIGEKYRVPGDDMVTLAKAVREAPNDIVATGVIADFDKRASASTSNGKRRVPPSPAAKIESAILRTESALKSLDAGRLAEDARLALRLRVFDHATFVKSIAEGL